jgi:transcriptional regulator with XRE-family HTH domain
MISGAGIHPLRAMRRALYLSIEDLATATGLSARTILRAEQGQSLNPDSLRLLCRYFNRSADELGLVARRSPPRRPSEGPSGSPAGVSDGTKRREVLFGAAGGSLLVQDDWTPASSASLVEMLEDEAQPSPATVRRLAHEWLLAPPPQIGELQHGRHIGERLIGRVERRVQRLRRMDDFLGGADLHALVEHELRATMQLLNEAAYGEALGRRLLIVAGELCQLAGWVTDDAGRHHAARRYYTLGIRAAHAAGNAPLAANLISTLSYQLATVGSPHDATLLAHTAYAGARASASATTLALLQERIAWAHARAGDLRQCERALGEAERVFARRDPADDPPWVYWLSQDELEIMAGRCYTELHQPQRAEPQLRAVLARYDETLAREVSLYSTWLAEVYLQMREIDQAATVATRALILAARVNSARGRARVSALRQQLQPFGAVKSVQDFEELYVTLIK